VITRAAHDGGPGAAREREAAARHLGVARLDQERHVRAAAREVVREHLADRAGADDERAHQCTIRAYSTGIVERSTSAPSRAAALWICMCTT
jgi:hypothetical protein